MKLVLLVLLLLAPLAGLLAQTAYDPLAVDSPAPPPIELSVPDAGRSRVIPLRIYLPARKTPAPVVIFSHGLGGTPQGYAYLGEHWAARGYVVVFPQHHGSDDAVWKEVEPSQRMAALEAAASVASFLDRAQDVPAVIDRLTQWNQESGHPLAGRLDLQEIGMSGHSFGAITTQAVSGQSLPLGGQRYSDPRIQAALPMSPSAPPAGDAATAFGSVKIPWLLMTGSKDASPISNAGPETRLVVFPALPAGDKYELVLDNAEHSAFTERPLPGDREPRNPNHHRAILALSTAFWDAYLRHDAAAKDWLQGNGPRTILEEKDRWQKK